jgi:Tol biopolymer transport system component
MGEVFRARDTRLDRDVAVKILPETFALDPERLARFDREAKTLASLNHPHIAQVFGLEDATAADGRRVRAIVMELVEGEDLSQRLARAPVPLDDALQIGLQIADALEAAHERGIVHRDLKPANVKMRPDGAVKVLDFGLAKAVEGSGAEDGFAGRNIVNSPTFTSPMQMTQAGVILGTAAYMAPEQARGKPVDRRADIWAFGCVLFELLSRRQPFDGETVTDVLAAIVTREPDWPALPARTPAAVRHLLARCLDKDPRRRLRDIGEARVTLAEEPGAAPQAPEDRRAAAANRRGWLLAAGAVIVAIAAAAAGYMAGAGREPIAARPVLTSFSQITDQPGIERQPSISPDGKSVVYVSHERGNSDLYLLRIGGRKAILLTEDSPADDYAPAFSPDGSSIAFRSERSGGGIFIMEATGESVRRVTDAGYDPRWSPDGKQLVVADERVGDPMSRALLSHLWVVDIAGGKRRRILAVDGVGPRWSPNGRRIVFWGRSAGSQRDIATAAADGSEERSPVWITSDDAVDWSPTWAPDGRYVYFGSSRGGTMNLWRVPVDESTGRTLGEPESITTPSLWSGDFDFARDGHSLVFANQDDRTTIWAASLDPIAGTIVGQPRPVLQGRAINSVDVSPDGRSIVFSQRGQPWESLGLVRIDGSGWTRLTDDVTYHRVPKWSPDGQLIAFYASPSATTDVWTIRPDGSGLAPMTLPQAKGGFFYPVWDPDGSRLAVTDDQSLAIVDLKASPPTVTRFPSDPSNPDIRPFSWSPDGRRIAGISRTGMRDALMIADVQSGTRRILRTAANSPAWLPDSRHLLYSGLTHLVLLDTQSGAERQVMRLYRSVDQWGRSVSLSRDGRTLVYLQSQGEGDVWVMKIG